MGFRKPIDVLHIFTSILLLGLLSIPASANIPFPRLKPEPHNTSLILTEHDARNFRFGMRAAQRHDWSDVSLYEKRLHDPTAKRILRWQRAGGDPHVSFDTLTDVVQTQSDWPRMVTIRAKAEAELFDHPLVPQETINWFLGLEPVSGEGRAALAHAYYRLGNRDLGDRWLRAAWCEARLTRDRQKYLFGLYKHRLTQEDHAARADHLIWMGTRYYSSASGLLPLMSKGDRALMDARMRVGANRSGMDQAIKAVPKSLLEDAGLLYERARWRRKHRSESYALPVYLQLKTPPRSEQAREKVWQEKKYMTYWALKKKKYQVAYDLTRYHGLEKGAAFAEAEFLAGWIALVHLDQAKVAAIHFTNLKNGVSLPISVARASYWRGRAAKAMNDALAMSYFSEAAKYPHVYYGQLAAEELSPGYATVVLPPEDDGQGIKDQFESRELVRALRLIGEIQDERAYNQFSFHLDDIFEDKRELSLLSALNKEYGFMKPSVRAAKQAGRYDTILTESGYPKPPVIVDLNPQFDIPFVLAIARQESEFNTRAQSHAQAYGLMQMIHSTAKSTARRAKMPYKREWLISDPEYAARLGSYHLSKLIQEFDGSYIMATAAYNAGSSRVKQWNRTYGDPRKGHIDPIDWVESIPYSETRNYVQRVMENLSVYRARLNSDQAELRITRDLREGAH